jgi:hypothetical protein
MKNFKLPVLGFSLLLFVASCKKEDVKPVDASVNQNALVSANSSQWKSLSNWSTLAGDKATYFSKLADSAITADVARTGLVLAFAKGDEGIQALPFSGKDNSYWYYQISKGSISFTTDASNASVKQFSYFVFSQQQLQQLEASGYSKSKLMQMTYNDVATLLKK